ncbi:hypothetical protein TNCV_4391921 [Trichonephila clavipes]|nr:hypothetical protein TNCV_4391921 [Trichonephila clavipes]
MADLLESNEQGVQMINAVVTRSKQKTFFPEKEKEANGEELNERQLELTDFSLVRGRGRLVIPAFEGGGGKSLAEVNGVEFKKEQRKCPDLKPLWDKAQTGIDKEFRIIRGEVARTKRAEEVRELCVLIKFRLDINKLSHDEIGGHLGETKTKDRILMHFFGPTCTETWRSSSKLAIRVSE